MWFALLYMLPSVVILQDPVGFVMVCEISVKINTKKFQENNYTHQEVFAHNIVHEPLYSRVLFVPRLLSSYAVRNSASSVEREMVK